MAELRYRNCSRSPFPARYTALTIRRLWQDSGPMCNYRLSSAHTWRLGNLACAYTCNGVPIWIAMNQIV